ncbi:MAG: hypothetical protein AAF662_03135 [Pseudomonadota bacterium]
MKTPADLRAVGARLEEAVALLPGDPASPQDLYDRYEMVAIAILDSEHAEFAPRVLEHYLTLYLKVKAMECGSGQEMGEA